MKWSQREKKESNDTDLLVRRKRRQRLKHTHKRLNQQHSKEVCEWNTNLYNLLFENY